MATIYLKPEVVALAEVAARIDGRAALNGVYLDKEKNIAVATNGFALAQAPIDLAQLKKSIIVPVAAFEGFGMGHLFLFDNDDGLFIGAMRRKDCKNPGMMSDLTRLQDCYKSRGVKPIEKNYPTYDRIYPTAEPVYRIALGPAVLAQIAAMAARSEHPGAIIFEFQKHAPSAHRFRTYAGISGAVMPCRLYDNTKQGLCNES